jgi:hypothetical protein
MLKEKAGRLIRALPKALGKVKHPLFYLAALLLMAAPPVSASTWDVTSQFSASANPNGVWEYAYEQGTSYEPSGGSFTLMTPNGASTGWTIVGNVLGTPGIWKNFGLTTSPQNVAPGQVALHPGFDTDTALTVARWTSPISGTVNVSGFFGAGDIGVMSYYILYNNNYTNRILSDLNDPNTKTFSFNQSVYAGDTIDFVVGPNTNGSYYYGSTPLDATITTVPIPGALWLLGSGLLGLTGWRRIRKS